MDLDKLPVELQLQTCEYMSIPDLKRASLSFKSLSVCSEILKIKLTKIDKLLDDIISNLNAYSNIIFIVPGAKEGESDDIIYINNNFIHEGILKKEGDNLIFESSRFDRSNLKKLLWSIINRIIDIEGGYFDRLILYTSSGSHPNIRIYNLSVGAVHLAPKNLVQLTFITLKGDSISLMVNKEYAKKYL